MKFVRLHAEDTDHSPESVPEDAGYDRVGSGWLRPGLRRGLTLPTPVSAATRRFSLVLRSA